MFGNNLIWRINLFRMIGGFYIGERYCTLHALGNKIENLAVFNLVDFCNSPNHQNKFYAKFSFYIYFNDCFIRVYLLCNSYTYMHESIRI